MAPTALTAEAEIMAPSPDANRQIEGVFARPIGASLVPGGLAPDESGVAKGAKFRPQPGKRRQAKGTMPDKRRSTAGPDRSTIGL